MTTSGNLLTRAYGPVVSGRTWRATANTFLELWVAWFAASAVLVPLVVAIPLVIILPVAVLMAIPGLVGNRIAAAFDRYRADVLLDLSLASPFPPLLPHDRRSAMAWWRRFVAELRDPALWRALAYRVLSVITSAVFGAVLAVVWCIPLTALTAPLWLGAMPNDRIDLGPVHLSGASGVLLPVLLGLILIPIAPVVTRGVADAQRGLARTFLGPRGERVLTERITQVETSRARVVDAAEAERRRIERDLHDGAQQRLVALAMQLGMAKEKMGDDPDAASALVDEAHAEAKRALVELRDLARGLHPAVLTDRGLGPALSAVAARSPVPVEVRVDLRDRPDATTEGIAYFVVCEALANVAKHSGARRATVSIGRRGDRLVVEVSDDGRGGATLVGSGLSGLQDRVQAVDGWLHVASPPGGPTTVTAELPCAS
ncbi:MAG: sensor histidine kinase [Actinobacteria bacterium]|nr:sensor histidine kinase [Actinomycetota bacterium]